MNKLLLLIMLLLFISKAGAQDFFADSLTKVAANAKSDSGKVDALIELARHEAVDLQHLDTAIIIWKNAFKISGQKKLYTQQVQALNWLAGVLYYTGKSAQGDSLLQNAIVFYRQHQLKAQEVDLLLLLSGYIVKKDSVQLLIAQALSLSVQYNLVKQQINALSAMAQFIAPGKPDSAKAFFSQALAISRRHNLYENEVGVLQGMARTYASNNWGDSAKSLIQEALDVARENHLAALEINLLATLNNSQDALFLKDSLTSYYERRLLLNRELHKDSLGIMITFGGTNWITGNYPLSLKVLLNVLHASEERKDSLFIGIALNQIAQLYQAAKDFHKSIHYCLQSIKYLNITQREYNLDFDIMAVDYSELRQNDSARYYADKAIKLYGSNIPDFVSDDLGLTYLKLGEDSLAIYYLRKSYSELSQPIIDYFNYAEATMGLANYFKKAGMADSSFFYAKLCFNVSQKNGLLNRLSESSGIIADYYNHKHNMDSAYHYQQVGFETYKTLDSTGNTQQVQNMSFAEQQKEQEVAQAKKTAADQYASKLRLYGLMTAALVAIAIGLIVYRNNRRRQKSFDLLKKQKQEIDLRKSQLETSLSDLQATQAQLIQSEKMASLGELTAGIAHEIQNPLNFVNNFSDLNKELLEELKEEVDKGNMENVKTIANDVIGNEEKINHHGKRADAIVKGMLQHSRQTKGVKELTNLNALCDEFLRLSYHGLRAKDKSFNADFTTDFDERISKINLVPQDMGRVLLNLFNNAFYAVNEKSKTANEDYKPLVSIQTKTLSDAIEIIISDNGNGIPQSISNKIFQPFFTTKPTGQGTGLGLSLSYDIITKEHNGILQVESKEKEGSVFIIQLPITT